MATETVEQAIKATEKTWRDMASRLDRAQMSFIECVQGFAGCSEEQAIKVLSVYTKHKLVTLDPLSGGFHVKHGAFLDKNTLWNAIES